MSSTYARELITSIRQRVLAAIDANQSGDKQRQAAFQQFFLQPNGTEGEGRSKIQIADVNNMVTAIQAQMVISFSTDMVVEYEAEGAEDVQAARAESKAVNRVLMEQNRGFGVIRDAAQNALLYRNARVKVWWANNINNFFVDHVGIKRADLPFAVEDQPGTERRLVSYDEKTKTARVEVTETRKVLRCEAVALDRFFYDADWNEPSLLGCPLVGEVHYKTRNELSRMGVKDSIINQLKTVARYSGTESDKMKRRGRQDAASGGTVDRSTEVCRVFEVCVEYGETERDNRSYLHKCWIGESGDFWLLDPELISRIPYASGSAFPVANQAEGQALSEKLYWTQEGKTELFRQWIDNVRNCSWGRVAALENQANMDDVLSPRAGGAVRVKRLDAVVPIPVVDVGQSIGLALEYLDKMRSESGGAALDMIGAEMQVANDTAHGTERVYASKELLVSMMTRNIAESLIREMFLLGHAELKAGNNGPISIEVADEWQQVDPAQWKARSHCNVTVGYSMGERMHMQGILQNLMNATMQLLPTMEDELVSKAGLYKLLTDYAAVGLVDNSGQYFIDPQSPAAKQARAAKAQAMAAQQQAIEAANQQQIDLMKGIEELKASVDQYKSDSEIQWKYFNTVIDAMQKASDTEMGGAVEILNAASEAEAARIAGPQNGGGGSAVAKNGSAGKRGAGSSGSGRANGSARANQGN